MLLAGTETTAVEGAGVEEKDRKTREVYGCRGEGRNCNIQAPYQPHCDHSSHRGTDEDPESPPQDYEHFLGRVLVLLRPLERP